MSTVFIKLFVECNVMCCIIKDVSKVSYKVYEVLSHLSELSLTVILLVQVDSHFCSFLCIYHELVESIIYV